MHNLARGGEIIWLHGPAGVGKSAILQTLAETESESPTSILGATLFFSRLNKRYDPQRVFITIAYQPAVKYPSYRQYVLGFLATDPKVVRKSMAEQFKRFIVHPFAERKLEGLHETVLILLDGLDECLGERAQRDILLLIGKLALQYPTVPCIRVIASRPEPHIEVAFSFGGIGKSYLEIEVPVHSTEACADVECYLRDKFSEIRQRFPASFSATLHQWPSESQFLRLATGASGLFHFAYIAIHFIGDEDFGNPFSQLQKVLDVIDSTPLADDQINPFAILDALYREVLSAIPQEVYPITKRILQIMLTHPAPCPFYIQCSWFGLTQADVYGALRKLHSVLHIPPPEKLEESSRSIHTSFIDYLVSPSRSRTFV